MVRSIIEPIFWSETECGSSNRNQSLVIEWMDPHTQTRYSLPSGLTAAAEDVMVDPRTRTMLLQQYEELVRNHFQQNLTQIIHSDAHGFGHISKFLSMAFQHYVSPLHILNYSDPELESFTKLFASLSWNALDKHRFEVEFFKFLSHDSGHRTLNKDSEHLVSGLILCGLGEHIQVLVAMGVTREIYCYTKSISSQNWDEPLLPKIEDWCRSQLYSNILTLLCLPGEGQTLIEDRLLNIGREAYTELRIEELYKMVVHFPQTEPAILELKTCLQTPLHRASVVSKFQFNCNKHLLQGGVQTTDIIKMYISTLKAFIVLEPRGILLDKALKPISRYLKMRGDSVSCIVEGMLGEPNSPLSFLLGELQKKPAESRKNNSYDWQPDPIDASSDFSQNAGYSDIIGSLLSLSQTEVFVRKFTEVFAERMLKDASCLDDIAQSIRLLKERFGSRELQNLEVMFKDMTDSIKLNTAIRKRTRRIPMNFNTRVVSKLYWPNLVAEEYIPPKGVSDTMLDYSSAYSQEKAQRVVKFVPSAGTVHLKLEFKDRTDHVIVTPLEASTILVFEDGLPRSIQEVANKIGVSDNTARSLCLGWMAKKVLTIADSDRDTFHVVERLNHENSNEQDMDEIEAQNGITNSEEQALSEMQVYWPFINQMLSSLDKMPADRIHSFLATLMPKETPYNKTKEELENYLLLKVEEGTLQFTNGEFKLKK